MEVCLVEIQKKFTLMEEAPARDLTEIHSLQVLTLADVG